MCRSIRKKIILVCLSFIWLSCNTSLALADEIVLSGNGNDSANSAANSTTHIESTTSNNSATIDNTVNVNANTGNNTTSDNTGAAQITTGIVSTDTTIENTANANISSPACCGTKGTMVFVSGNGPKSQNNAGVSTSASTNTTINQTASVTTTIHGTANTGGNTANNNSGNVTIHTGKIAVSTTSKTGPLNYVRVDSTTGKPTRVSVEIQGNGPNSTNSATLSAVTDTTSTTNSVVTLFTNLFLSLVTGENEASGNTGDVSITTGDIEVQTLIENGAVNFSSVTVDCACPHKQNPPETPATPSPEKVTPQSPSSDKTSSSGAGEVASISFGKELPVTGMNWLFFAFIGNVMMLLLGTILRLRSGNSPGVTA